MSSQDWCGQSFMQLNLDKDEYDVHQYSYFESEGDKDFSIDAALMEDELFNRIRINPEVLPTGKIKIIPSVAYVRLLHSNMQPETVEAQMSNAPDTTGVRQYTIIYNNRKLIIDFLNDFPHDITGWTETYEALDGKTKTTTARRVKKIKAPYWKLHNPADSTWRKQLGLEKNLF